MANITLSDWSAINLNDFSTQLSTLDGASTELSFLLSGSPSVRTLTNLQITGSWAGWNFSILGTGLTSNSPVINKFSMSSGIDYIKFAGNFGLAGGTITSIALKMGTTQGAFSGVLKFNSNFDLIGGTVSSASISESGFKASFVGSMIINAAGDIAGGKVTSFVFEDPSGHKLAVSGISMNTSLFDSLSDSSLGHADLTDLFNALDLSGNDNISGGTLGDNLFGSSGNDILKGGLGNDTQDGGEGNDLYYITSAAEHTVAEINDTGLIGTDEVRFAAANILGGNTLTLFANDTGIERVVIGTGGAVAAVTIGTAALNIDASAVLNALTITGNAGANTLSGTGFNDTLNGGAGIDKLNGGTGNDILNGGVGADTMKGGAGNDTYVVDNLLDVVNEEANTDTDDLIQASISINLTQTKYDGIEHVTLTGVGVINATGDENNNILIGNAAVNILDGGLGADTMDGGKGNDVYIVDNSGDTVAEAFTIAQGGGFDTVKSSVSYTLGVNIDRLMFTGTDNINGTGNALNNILVGNTGNNSLDGGAGVDALQGGLGNDTYTVDLIQTGTTAPTFRVALQDIITEAVNAGTDSLILRGNFNHINATTLALATTLENLDASQTGTTKLNLTGNALNNILAGNDANNILSGGAGTDSLTGGLGADTFDFNLITESPTGAGHDVITDFNAGELDRIDLSTIDANILLAGNQAFNFIGVDVAFSNVAGQLSFNSTTHILSGDVNGNGVADFEIALTGVTSLTAGNFVL